jgi:hypothetical protein
MLTLTTMPGNKFFTGIMFNVAEISGYIISLAILQKCSDTKTFNIGAIISNSGSVLLIVLQLWIESESVSLFSIGVFLQVFGAALMFNAMVIVVI